MKKILMMIPLWKRPEIVRLFIYKMLATMPDYFELIPFFILSPEDPHYKVLKKLTSGFKTFEYKNDPLGEKKNAGLFNALQLDWDYYIDMGSDNVWSCHLWELYRKPIEIGYLYFGVLNMHVFDLLQNRAKFIKGYHINPCSSTDEPTAIGVGRCIHRSVINKLGPLWRNNFNMGMDGSSHYKIEQSDYQCTVIDNGTIPTVLDIKTSTNINTFKEIENEGEEIHPRKIYEWFNLNQFNIFNSDFTKLVTFKGFKDEVIRLRNIYKNQEEAFKTVNTSYEIGFGEKRYKNYRVYLSTQTRKA